MIKGKGRNKESMLSANLRLEFVRIFSNSRVVAFLVLFTFLAVFFTYSGIVHYKNFLQEKKFFLAHEKDKVNLYVSYNHYGDYGFRVLYEPLPLILFFSNSSVFENLYANIDMTEILKITSSYKGKDLLLKKGGFKDFGGLLFLMGSIFMVFMGMSAYRSEKYFFYFSNIILRWLILATFFGLLMFTLYHILSHFGIHFSTKETVNFFLFCLYTQLFLCFFYGCGLLTRIFCKNLPATYIYVAIFWFLSIIILPGFMSIILEKRANSLPTSEEQNLIKLKEIMSFEREVRKKTGSVKTIKKREAIYHEMVQQFLRTGYLKNTKLENDTNDEITNILEWYENLQLFYPSTFFLFLNSEISGKGYSGYTAFVNYSLSLRDSFVRYYIYKRYKSNESLIVPFTRQDENVFIAHSQLPHTFASATLLTLSYILVLFSASHWVIRKRQRPIPMKKPLYKFEKGNMYFILCRDEQHKEFLFNSYQMDTNTACVNNINAEEIDLGVGITRMINYFILSSGVDSNIFYSNLNILGISKNELEQDKKQKKQRRPELIQKIYCALAMAHEQEIIVVKDFLKRKSMDMERRFLGLVNRLTQSGKIVIYLSTEIFLTSLPFVENIKNESYTTFIIDPLTVSLR